MDTIQFFALIVLVLTCDNWSPHDGSYLTAAATQVANYTAAETRLLSFYGINDTGLLPGQVYCPQTGALDDSYKQNTIYIGLLACSKVDPALSSNQKYVLADSSEERRPRSTDDGYYSPIPG